MTHIPAPAPTTDRAQSGFLAIISELRASEDAAARGWHHEPHVNSSGWWIVLHNQHAASPEQGWKLHISAASTSAETVLRRALPVLFAENAEFKVAASIAKLNELNRGNGELSQIGKFITIYPNDDAQAVRLAVALNAATAGLRGPAIPSDRPLTRDSLVHYRYGAFGDQRIQTPQGRVLPAIKTPDGGFIPDPRLTMYAPPEWVSDPFVAAGVVDELPEPTVLVAGRYLLASTIDRSARGMVHLAADLVAQRRCILKRATRDALVGRGGLDARDDLRYEARVLALLASDPRFPAVYELVEQDGDLFLAMEDVEGETLATYIGKVRGMGRTIPNQQLIAWGRELAAMLDALHAKGFIYCDLKASNVVVAPDGRLRIIDFDIAYQPESGFRPRGHGTGGYMSPQQAAHLEPTVGDDVYTLGAVLYYLAGGAEPSTLSKNTVALMDRPLSLLNPSCSPDLIDVIGRCLAADPAERFPSMREVDAALAAIGAATMSVPAFGAEPAYEDEQTARERARESARRLGDSLCQVARPVPGGQGLAWSDDQPGIGSKPFQYLWGGAGAVLALAELVAAFDLPEHRRVFLEGVRWLRTPYRPLGSRHPGLYVGEAGIGAVLLRAGQVLGDSDLIAEALERGRAVATLPHTSPDLVNGTAGRLRLHLLLWQETGEADQLRAAIEAGEYLLATAEVPQPGQRCWRIPPGFDDSSDQVYLGYAHGAAGIGDVLLDLFAATHDERFLAAAQDTGRWLAQLAVPALDDNSGLNWTNRVGDRNATHLFWCHGATGIGRFFLHLARREALPEAATIAARAARAVARGARWASPTQCHGLAGNIEFLLDMFQATGETAYLSEARAQARLLDSFATEQDGLLVWPSELSDLISPSYMVGYAGVALCQLRLSDPENLPDLGVSGVQPLRHAVKSGALL